MVSAAAIGQPVGHVEGPEKVSGRMRYTADIDLPGMLWGRCLRSPYPHARIVSIDTSRAAALPGVRATITGAELPDSRIGRRVLDVPVLARDKARFVGEKIAAVAADSRDLAEEALTLIEVEYEELPAVLDPLEALAPDAPRVHDDPGGYRGVPQPVPDIPNVLAQVRLTHGDVEAGFAQADQIFEHTFRVPSVHQGYIEPHACLVRLDGEMIDVWLSNKTPFVARAQIADALQVPQERVRVHSVPLGGDFGGKGSIMDAIVCYRLAERAGQPVRMVMSYTEELTAGCPRHTAVITLRTGVTKDGRMTARSGRLIYDTGAYGAFTPNVMVGGPAHAAGPYRLPNIDIEGLRVYTNHVPAGNMRAPGAPQAIFAEESHMDMIARGLGLDPFEFRLRNALVEGDESPTGHRYADLMERETLQAAADASGWYSPKPPNVGRGMSVYDRAPGSGESNQTISIDGEAQITLLTGTPDTGTGSLTIMQQVAAAELQVPLQRVTIQTAGTDVAAFDSGAGGSRVTRTAGRATQAAAVELRTALTGLAARILNVPEAQVRYEGGVFSAGGGAALSLADLMRRAQELEEAPITRTGSYASANDPSDVTCFSVQVAEVEVDPETGQVKLRRFTSAHDVGTVINPLTHQGQVEGGVVQGLGQATTERLLIEDGMVTNANLGDYKLMTMADIPELTTVLVENKHGPAPYEGKAIGEMSNVPVPAAVANAVADAIGVRVTELPITAEKVYQALEARRTARD